MHAVVLDDELRCHRIEVLPVHHEGDRAALGCADVVVAAPAESDVGGLRGVGYPYRVESAAAARRDAPHSRHVAAHIPRAVKRLSPEGACCLEFGGGGRVAGKRTDEGIRLHSRRELGVAGGIVTVQMTACRHCGRSFPAETAVAHYPADGETGIGRSRGMLRHAECETHLLIVRVTVAVGRERRVDDAVSAPARDGSTVDEHRPFVHSALDVTVGAALDRAPAARGTRRGAVDDYLLKFRIQPSLESVYRDSELIRRLVDTLLGGRSDIALSDYAAEQSAFLSVGERIRRPCLTAVARILHGDCRRLHEREPVRPQGVHHCRIDGRDSPLYVPAAP